MYWTPTLCTTHASTWLFRRFNLILTVDFSGIHPFEMNYLVWRWTAPLIDLHGSTGGKNSTRERILTVGSIDAVGNQLAEDDSCVPRVMSGVVSE